MRCSKARKSFLSYILDELGGDERERLTKHLATCPDCMSELESLEKTWNLLDLSEDIDPPEHLTQRIKRQVADLKGIEVKDQGRWPALRWSLVGAGVTLVCCILAFFLLRPFIGSGARIQAGEIKIGFYLMEHERAVRYTAFHNESRIPPSARWVPMRKEDMFYYEEAERGEAGIFLRGQSGRRNRVEDEGTKPRIVESELITLPDARRLMRFPIIAPEVLGRRYKLKFVLKIKDRECVQLVYSDGLRTISLFEQPVWTKNGIGRKDFQEYILHKAKEGSRNAVLGWITKETAFNLVGEVGFSELIQLAEEIQEKMTVDRLLRFYEGLYGR